VVLLKEEWVLSYPTTLWWNQLPDWGFGGIHCFFPSSLGLTLSFLMTPIVCNGSGNPEPSLQLCCFRPRPLGDFPWCTFPPCAPFTFYRLYTFVPFLLLTLFLLFSSSFPQQVALAWLFCVRLCLCPVLSSPNRSRQMAALPESGSTVAGRIESNWYLMPSCIKIALYEYNYN